MKLATGGRFLWMRTIGSTIVGQGLDSLIFYPLAFYGLAGWPPEQLVQVVISQWAIKTRSEEHTSELQSLMRISYAVFCLKKNIIHTKTHHTNKSNHTLKNNTVSHKSTTQ